MQSANKRQNKKEMVIYKIVQKESISSTEFGYHFNHLVYIDELNPALQFSIRVVENEPGIASSAAEESTYTLVSLFDELVLARNADLGLKYPELPSLKRSIVPIGSLRGDEEFKT